MNSKMLLRCAVVLALGGALTACGSDDNGDEDRLRADLTTRTMERDTARTTLATRTTERNTAIGERNTARTERDDAQEERDTAIGERNTATTRPAFGKMHEL